MRNIKLNPRTLDALKISVRARIINNFFNESVFIPIGIFTTSFFYFFALFGEKVKLS